MRLSEFKQRSTGLTPTTSPIRIFPDIMEMEERKTNLGGLNLVSLGQFFNNLATHLTEHKFNNITDRRDICNP